MFCTSNGLWDLLFSSSVLRLVVLRRSAHIASTTQEQNRKEKNHASYCSDANTLDRFQQTSRASSSPGKSNTHPFRIPFAIACNCDDDDNDESLKELFAPLLSSLYPWSHCPLGPSPDPFVVYEDNVLERRVVEIRHSQALGGDILVEDIALAISSTDDAKEVVGAEPNLCKLRRRMRFQQMPNLIQTEIPVAIYKDGHRDSKLGLHDVKLIQQRHGIADHEIAQTDLEVRPDHSKLVHKYLPPIVAGLVLASPCLEACIEANARARFLTIGLGGGALPLFLHKQFGFSVLAVDTDEVVVELARRHFGFVENEHLQVRVQDGVEALYSIAHQACRNSLASKEILSEWLEASKGLVQETFTVSDFDDPRMHVIVVDVCVSDACSALLSPPPCFLMKAFLLAVRLGLHEGGMLVINVIPRAEENLLFVVESLRKVFMGIYQIRIDDNHVLCAFISKITDIDMSCSFARLVADAVGEDFFNQIEEIENL